MAGRGGTGFSAAASWTQGVDPAQGHIEGTPDTRSRPGAVGSAQWYRPRTADMPPW